jgi:O-glycosyl hydrolase
MSSIVQTQTTSFKKELYEAVHNFTTDTFKIALYTASADLNAATTAYSATNEVTGTGYVAGGIALTGVTIGSDGYTAFVNFANAVFGASVTSRCALIYNSSKANRSVAVLDFGSDKTSANFTVTMPANTSTTALIRASN